MIVQICDSRKKFPPLGLFIVDRKKRYAYGAEKWMNTPSAQL